MKSLILGTAQLGFGYGITNDRRRITDVEAAAMMRAALDCGIRLFDTAADYDDSQDRLGNLFAHPHDAQFISKFVFPPGHAEVTVEQLFGASIRRLDVERLSGLLFHRVADLMDPRSAGALDLLREARSSGTIDLIGVSIYDVDDLTLALTVFPDLNILQLPGSVVDRRLLDDPVISDLHAAGVEIHVRSAFLQGLLLGDPVTFGDRFAELAPVVKRLETFAVERGIDRVNVALSFLAQHPNADGVLVGATSAAEVRSIARAWLAPYAGTFEPGIDLSVDVLDPRRW